MKTPDSSLPATGDRPSPAALPQAVQSALVHQVAHTALPGQLPLAVKQALIHPQRALEVQGWLKNAHREAHQALARAWRGDDGETMMHWAFLSHWGLALDLAAAGLAYDDVDRHGRTPMDWLNDRLWAAVVEPMGQARLSLAGAERLRRHTEDQVLNLWALGVRPKAAPGRHAVGTVWLRAGAWSLLPLLLEGPGATEETTATADDASAALDSSDRGPAGWVRWTPRGGSALHAWILAPDMPGRRAFLQDWQARGGSLECTDDEGHTPLWYAVDAWLSEAAWRDRLAGVIRELAQAGARLNHPNVHGVTVRDLVAGAAPEEQQALNALLMVADGQDTSRGPSTPARDHAAEDDNDDSLNWPRHALDGVDVATIIKPAVDDSTDPLAASFSS